MIPLIIGCAKLKDWAQRRWLALVATAFLIALASPAFAVQVVSGGDPFSYDAGTGVMTDHNGLQYLFRSDGTIKVLGSGSLFGLGIRGNYQGSWITKYVDEFEWVWVHSVDGQGNHWFNASVNQANFDWMASIVFFADPSKEMKIAYGIKNNLPNPVTNLKLFYLQTVANGSRLSFDNQSYVVRWGYSKHLTNDSMNLTAVVPKIVFPEYYAFNYADLVSSNFAVRDFFAGNASKFDSNLPSKLVVIVAVTKADGILNPGQERWADPTIVAQANSLALYPPPQRKAVYTSDGTRHIFFLNLTAGDYVLFWSKSDDDGATWVSATAVDVPDANYDHRSFAADVDSNDNIYLFATNGTNKFILRFGAYDGAGGWVWNELDFAPTDYSLSGTQQLSLAITPNDVAHLVYPNGTEWHYRSCDSECNESAANWNASNSSAGWDVIEGAGSYASVVDSPDGSIYFSIQTTAAANISVRQASNYTNNSYFWETAAAAFDYATFPVMAVAPNGDVHLVAANYLKPPSAVKRHAMHKVCRGDCDTAANWNASNGTLGFDVVSALNYTGWGSIGVDNTGAVYIVYAANKSVNYNFAFYAKYSSGAWAGPEELFDGQDVGTVDFYPQLSKTSFGNVMDIYYGNKSGAYSIVYSNLTTGAGGGEGFEFNVTNATYTSPVYETLSTNFNLTLDYNATNVSTLWYGHLVYDGVEFNASKADNGSTASFNKTHPAKFLIGSNNSAVSFRFSVHGNYSNGSAFVFNTSNYNQLVWYAWFWNAWTVSPTNLLAGQDALATLNTTRVYDTATVSAQIAWVGTNYSMTVDGFNFTRVVSAPTITASFGAVGWLNVTYNGTTRINMTSNTSITVISPSLVACNATVNQTVLNFTSRSEESNASVNFTMAATFWLWNALRTSNATYSAKWVNVAYVELCVYPNWASGQVDSIQEYYSDGYYPRNYFLDHANISNASTQNISLFLANTSLTKNTLFTLKDANGLLLSGYTIVVERYYPATNTFETIAMMRTDSGGAGITYLVPNDVSYVYVIVLDGVPVEIITPSAPIPCASALSQCTKELRLANVLIGEYYQTAGQIAGNCSWNPSTNLTVCVVSDGSGLSRSWRLTVTKLGLAANAVACVATLNTSSGVLTCPITEDGEYSVSLVALGSLSVVDSFTFVKGALTSLFGLDFVFLALIVVLSVGFAAIGSPAAGVFFLSVGVVFAKLLGLLVISVGATIMVFALGILIAWKLRK